MKVMLSFSHDLSSYTKKAAVVSDISQCTSVKIICVLESYFEFTIFMNF